MNRPPGMPAREWFENASAEAMATFLEAWNATTVTGPRGDVFDWGPFRRAMSRLNDAMGQRHAAKHAALVEAMHAPPGPAPPRAHVFHNCTIGPAPPAPDSLVPVASADDEED